MSPSAIDRYRVAMACHDQPVDPSAKQPQLMPEHPASQSGSKDPSQQAAPRIAAGPTMPSRKDREMGRKPAPSGWVSWWPVAVGVTLACLAPWLRAQLAAYEPWGMRAVFPFVLFAGRRELGLSDELTRTLPQLMLYLQFPLEGLLTKLTLSRRVPLSKALGQLVFLHGVCVLILWLVSGAAQ